MFLLFGIIVALAVCKPTVDTFREWQYILLFLLAVIVSPILFFLLGVLITIPIIGPIYYVRERVNGGPFRVGDTVYIIAGKHKGKVARVYSQWQHGTVRIELSEEEKEKFKDVFASYSILRVSDSDQENCIGAATVMERA